MSSADFNAPDIDTLIADMFATMYAANGVGLAANQVSVDLKVFVYDLTDSKGVRSWGVICNPCIEIHDDGDGEHHHPVQQGMQSMTEGCLSYPGICAPVSRSCSITMRGVDQRGKPTEFRANGLLAQILQHETDHLNGVVYGDHVPREVRKRMDEQYEEIAAKNGYPDDWPVSKAKHRWTI